MKYIILLLLSLGTYFNCVGQTYLSFNFGKGSYDMAQLKTINNDYLNSFPVDLKIVDDFPNRPYFGMEVSHAIKIFEYGVGFCNNTTGSKVHYKDYSGEVIFTQQLKATAITGFAKLYLVQYKNIGWNINAGLAFSNTKLTLEESIKVFDQTEKEKYNLVSLEYRFNIGSELSYKLKMFRFSAFAGFEKTFKANGFSLADNPDSKFQDSAGNAYKPSWTGMRVGIKLGIDLSMLSDL